MIKKPDVALIMNVANGFWLPLLRMRGIPTVVNVDGIEWERAKWGRAAKFVFKLGARFTAAFADELISDSIEIQRRWREEFKRESLFIPYGGDEPKAPRVLDGLTSGDYVLAVARFVPENTILEFFEAVESIAEDYPIVIVGSSGYGGDLDEKAKSLAAAHSNIRWLGHVSDDSKLMSLWHHAGAYFHGHSVGGTNPALVQAMACGAPIVARKTPYNVEVLGSEAHLVEPTPQDIERGLREMLANPDSRRATSVRNVARAREFYSWTGVSSAYEEAIANVSKKVGRSLPTLFAKRR
jgi:glycosyltransferase involved in cell wall biosynthesis